MRTDSVTNSEQNAADDEGTRIEGDELHLLRCVKVSSGHQHEGEAQHELFQGVGEYVLVQLDYVFVTAQGVHGCSSKSFVPHIHNEEKQDQYHGKGTSDGVRQLSIELCRGGQGDYLQMIIASIVNG